MEAKKLITEDNAVEMVQRHITFRCLPESRKDADTGEETIIYRVLARSDIPGYHSLKAEINFSGGGMDWGTLAAIGHDMTLKIAASYLGEETGGEADNKTTH